MLRKRKQLFNTDFYRIVYFVPPSNIQTDFEFHQSLKNICPKLEIISNLPKGSDISGNNSFLMTYLKKYWITKIILTRFLLSLATTKVCPSFIRIKTTLVNPPHLTLLETVPIRYFFFQTS
jgi:hypothetical protein